VWIKLTHGHVDTNFSDTPELEGSSPRDHPLFEFDRQSFPKGTDLFNIHAQLDSEFWRQERLACTKEDIIFVTTSEKTRDTYRAVLHMTINGQDNKGKSLVVRFLTDKKTDTLIYDRDSADSRAAISKLAHDLRKSNKPQAQAVLLPEWVQQGYREACKGLAQLASYMKSTPDQTQPTFVHEDHISPEIKSLINDFIAEYLRSKKYQNSITTVFVKKQNYATQSQPDFEDALEYTHSPPTWTLLYSNNLGSNCPNEGVVLIYLDDDGKYFIDKNANETKLAMEQLAFNLRPKKNNPCEK